ncbi:MAG TPA: hypothetical protein VF701_04040 [Thermoanaerobaculia bacterium]
MTVRAELGDSFADVARLLLPTEHHEWLREGSRDEASPCVQADRVGEKADNDAANTEWKDAFCKTLGGVCVSSARFRAAP